LQGDFFFFTDVTGMFSTVAPAQKSSRMKFRLTLGSRAFWLRQMRQWHWISAAICLIGIDAAVRGHRHYPEPCRQD
jgi:hypothetical protein